MLCLSQLVALLPRRHTKIDAQELRGEVLSLRSELKKEFLGSGEDPGA